MLPVIGAVLLCAQSVCALAADATTTATSSNSAQQLRAKVEAQRDQLSGVANVSQSVSKSSATVLDAPVVTDDAPSQAQQQP